ncbi:MAG TPA: alpha/beta hydrolase [Usitatibacter sp.]|nr:alpha/beta hydrolase [Usitatibacter sp.]
MLKRLAIGAGAALIVLVIAFMAWVGDVLTRPALATIGPPPADLGASDVVLTPPGGAKVSGWLVPGDDGKAAVLLLHGVRANRLQMLERARWLHGMGYSVLLIDQPAHGESPADRITFGAHEANGVTAALAYLEASRPGRKIGVIGVSMGAASLVLSNPKARDLGAVVLESMYPTIEEALADRIALDHGKWAQAFAPLLLWQLPLRTGVWPAELRPIAAIGSLHVPLLVAAGSIDRHTTLSETRRIFAAANPPKELWIVDGAAHVDLFAFDRKAYATRVGGFLREHLR